jgi:hypothetical protein
MDQQALSSQAPNSTTGTENGSAERPFFYSDAPVPRAVRKLRDKLSKDSTVSSGGTTPPAEAENETNYGDPAND